ncbi:LRR receptor-like serine/threonine-protein kinase [Actinidia chinensis var. chinensis]|uniref:non-specific serine/threonine protein kinase n=1 Tax=Actinidia chinensis var. chinensis TaxID=1590841 RepID=A0A2R6RBI7_ACTCC|nr:LRR receptor-like serine/threonine-protein kinase [Actinidia chinensis var. chinensis]
MSLCLLIFLALASMSYGLTLLSAENPVSDHSCPLNFDVLREVAGVRSVLVDDPRRCRYVLEGMRLIRSEYLRTHGQFLPPSSTSKACWVSYRALVKELVPNFDIESSCGYHPEWVSRACKNVTTGSQFERLIPESKLKDLRENCNQQLQNSSQCALCTNYLLKVQAHLEGLKKDENVSDCSGYPYIYAAALINRFGPTDKGTKSCLFSFRLSHSSAPPRRPWHVVAISGAMMGCLIGIFGAALAVAFMWRLHERKRREKKNSYVAELKSISASAYLVMYNFEEIRNATMNFSRENLIGTGGYGNVYRGKLQDGSEVAVKRFKNCSVSGNTSFAHEVEVIASVKHINLVNLKGYCTATEPLQGHQRMIVCDLMHNGSLYDHLFGSGAKRLPWPIRQRIALGTAHGLAYLHCGAQPGIIHRDIKASNILLDEKFDPKVADFGLAKFNPREMTHLNTRVAGTLGYVAPEYALYGKLSEGSDVYSFGVVLLELVSGKKAVLSAVEGKTCLLTDWAWSLVRQGRALDVVEENMPEMGSQEVMEQYVFIAVFCCHPNLHARPTMDQIVKLLETNGQVSLFSGPPVYTSTTDCL